MDILQAITNRRSIRKFRVKPVAEADVMRIIECGQRAPSACSLQTYSTIWVKDENKRRILWEACGKQSFILEAPVTLVPCADIRKIMQIMKHERYETSFEKGLGYRTKLFAIIDAALAAENMVLAAEALGLGSVFAGGALGNPKVREALNLPKGVLPISLLCIGYPDENPPIRPRLQVDTTLFVDAYRSLQEDQIEEDVNRMNKALLEEGYYVRYGKRSSDFTWINNVERKLAEKKETEETFAEEMKKAGFYPFEPVT